MQFQVTNMHTKKTLLSKFYKQNLEEAELQFKFFQMVGHPNFLRAIVSDSNKGVQIYDQREGQLLSDIIKNNEKQNFCNSIGKEQAS